MKPTNQLFDIIKSLTTEEEKKFKLLSSLQQGEKNYIKLFNFIQKQESYDEDDVKTHFKNEVFVQHFASEKNQLLHHILKCLRLQRQETSASARIDEEIKNIQLLFNKSLYKQSRKQLSIIKKMAHDYELFYSLLEIIELEKVLIDMEAHFGDINYRTLDELIEEENGLFNKIENFAGYELQLAKLNALSSKLMIARSKEDVKEISDIIKETKRYANQEEFLSNKSRILFLFITGVANMLLNEMDEVHKSFSELIIELENKPEIISEMPFYYIVSHGYLVRYCALKKQYTDGFKMIDKLKSLALNEMFKATDLQITIFTQSYITEMVLYSYIGQHDKATNVIPYVIKGLEKYEAKINNEELVRIYHTISMVYFGVGEYNKALHWLNKIINTNYEDLRQDIIRISKLINLIVHFELGNDDLLAYIYKSSVRFFAQQEKQYRFETVFLDYFKKIALSKRDSKQKETYIKFKEELEKVFKDKYEKNALEYFNFYAWLDSKIHTISFADAIKIRRQNI
ncbi:MAG: hypothetical protein H7141_12475 [Burkholderiales bacterium]|nr:hypothetical protein [Bacteroidia bacterium]